MELSTESTVRVSSGAGPITMPHPPAPARSADRPCIDCLDEAPALGRYHFLAPRPAAFRLVAALFAVTMLGVTLPAPL
jgi:hypothetical protein